MMQFTSKELKLIERLRTEERRWPRTRWILVASAAFSYAIGACLAYYLVGLIESDDLGEDGSILAFAYLWPKCVVCVLLGAWLTAWAIRDWNSNVNRMLLLRLLDEQQKN
jgi:hypothetical protein